MKIACWSGPRNISTALMRSWSSRSDTFVSDEPFYSYYLKETGINHPMKNQIIDQYDFNKVNIINYLHSKNPENKNVWYQKHMAHHLLSSDNLFWIKKFNNCILIRHPKKVINSYVKKNNLRNVLELGYKQQYDILKFLKKEKMDFFIIDSDDLLDDPTYILTNWCVHLGLKFDEKMLTWEKGPHAQDGIWGCHWYDNIYNSYTFERKKTILSEDYKQFISIYDESLIYYKKIYNMIN